MTEHAGGICEAPIEDRFHRNIAKIEGGPLPAIIAAKRTPRACANLATFRRKIGEAERWGRISGFAIFCKPGRI